MTPSKKNKKTEPARSSAKKPLKKAAVKKPPVQKAKPQQRSKKPKKAGGARLVADRSVAGRVKKQAGADRSVAGRVKKQAAGRQALVAVPAKSKRLRRRQEASKQTESKRTAGRRPAKRHIAKRQTERRPASRAQKQAAADRISADRSVEARLPASKRRKASPVLPSARRKAKAALPAAAQAKTKIQTSLQKGKPARLKSKAPERSMRPDSPQKALRKSVLRQRQKHSAATGRILADRISEARPFADRTARKSSPAGRAQKTAAAEQKKSPARKQTAGRLPSGRAFKQVEAGGAKNKGRAAPLSFGPPKARSPLQQLRQTDFRRAGLPETGFLRGGADSPESGPPKKTTLRPIVPRASKAAKERGTEKAEEITAASARNELQTATEREFVLKDMEGRDYCLFEDCGAAAVSGEYCRLHYIGRHEYIKARENILKTGWIHRKIEEIANKSAPFSLLAAACLIEDLRSKKSFAARIKPLLEDWDSSEDEAYGENSGR